MSGGSESRQRRPVADLDPLVDKWSKEQTHVEDCVGVL